MESQKNANPVRILIVDDHPNTATMLARVLSRFESPVEVVTASSGEEALKKIGDQTVDILITDFMMPGMNGLELIEKLEGEQKPGYIILITAYDTPGLAITARRLNVKDYLVKPVQPEKIRSIVSRVIEEIQPLKSSPEAHDEARPSFKILIADDYPDNLRLLSTRLRSEGFKFIAAWDGEETLKKVYEEEPDLVLLDVNMPKKDGFQVLAEMRANPQSAHIPVIIITAARIGPKDVREGLSLGADDYIIKPYDWRELAARIHSKLRVKQAEDVLRRRNKELGVLPEIGQELSARLDIAELAEIIVNRSYDTLKVNYVRLDVFQPDGSVFCCTRDSDKPKPITFHLAREYVLSQGMTSYVYLTREGRVVDDVRREEHWRPIEGVNALSAVIVPLLGRQKVIGVLTLAHEYRAYFNTEHQTLLQAIASQASIAIENAQLLNIEHKRVQDLIALNHIARELYHFTHSKHLLDTLPRLVQEKFGYSLVAVWDVLDTTPNTSQLISLSGASSLCGDEFLIELPERVIKNEDSIMWSDPARSISYLAVPLKHQNHIDKKQILGVLGVLHPSAGMFQESDLALLETLATQVVAALDKVALFESVEQEQRRLLAVLRSAADAILVLDNNLRMTLANPAGERLFDEDPTKLGQQLPENQGYDELIGLLRNVQSSGLPIHSEVNWTDGRTFSVLVTPIDEGGQVAVLHDITQFKALAALKNEYIATASHDLKNPIQSVLGYNDLLSKAGPLNSLQEDFSRRIRSSAQQMRELVLNLLEVSRLESGQAIHSELIDFNQLLEETSDEMMSQIQGKGQNLSIRLCNSDVHVMGDRLLLQQMIRNLLGNAIKYTPQGGAISITTAIDGDDILMEISDTGIGIPSKDLPKLFTKFFRVCNEATQDIEGTGLGLSIVQSIIKNHKGRIGVVSTENVGTTFSIRLPLTLEPVAG